MKRMILIVAALVAFVGVAMAGWVYDSSTVYPAVKTGTITWTNVYQNAAVELRRVYVNDCLDTNSTITFKRVSVSGANTDAVTVVYTGVAGTSGTAAAQTNGFTEVYLAYGEKVLVTTSPATGSTVRIEYLVEKH